MRDCSERPRWIELIPRSPVTSGSAAPTASETSGPSTPGTDSSASVLLGAHRRQSFTGAPCAPHARRPD